MKSINLLCIHLPILLILNQSISSTLNFDFNTEKDNTSNYFKENTLDRTPHGILKNKFFEANKDKKIISNKNHGISYCSKNIQLIDLKQLIISEIISIHLISIHIITLCNK